MSNDEMVKVAKPVLKGWSPAGIVQHSEDFDLEPLSQRSLAIYLVGRWPNGELVWT